MSNMNARKYLTVVKDEREDMANFMVDLFDDMTEQKDGKAAYHFEIRDQSKVIIIEVVTTPRRYTTIAQFVGGCYPGLCTFETV